jgi:RND superfamily putative drug exporter
MRRVALFSYRRRRSVLIGWIVLLVAVFALSQTAGGVYRNELALSGSESADAFDLLEQRGFADRAGFSGQIVFEADQGVGDAAVTVTRRQRGHRYRRW